MTNPFLSDNGYMNTSYTTKSIVPNEKFKYILPEKGIYLSNFGRLIRIRKNSSIYVLSKNFKDGVYTELGMTLIDLLYEVGIVGNSTICNDDKLHPNNIRDVVFTNSKKESKSLQDLLNDVCNKIISKEEPKKEKIDSIDTQIIAHEEKVLEENKLLQLPREELGKALVCGKDSVPDYLSKMSIKEFYTYIKNLDSIIINEAIDLYNTFSKPSEIITASKSLPIRRSPKTQGV